MAKQIKKLKTPNLQQPLTAELLGKSLKHVEPKAICG